jgi:hypothetical protein
VWVANSIRKSGLKPVCAQWDKKMALGKHSLSYVIYLPKFSLIFVNLISIPQDEQAFLVQTYFGMDDDISL